MKEPVVIIGIGEIGGVFARGLLRSGHPVFPVTRHDDPEHVAARVPEPALALVAVAEGDLHATLEHLPAAWHDRVGLLQNELLPRDWERYDLPNPTVVSVWFEKKKGQEAKALLPSPVFGPRSELVCQALAAADLECQRLATNEALLHALVVKNLYILTTNIAGLAAGGTVSVLWEQHRTLAERVAADIISIQEWLSGTTFSRNDLITDMLQAFAADPDHKCMGRSAPARLQRALRLANEAGLEVPELRRIREVVEG